MKLNIGIQFRERVQLELHVRLPGGIMRCSPSLLSSGILLLMLTMFCWMPAFAQDPPDVVMGMSPSATYHSGDFNSVDMATGRLNLRIPLIVDHSERGKLNFTYSVACTSTGAWNVVLTGRVTYNVEPPKYGVSSPALVTEGALSTVTVDQYVDDTVL